MTLNVLKYKQQNYKWHSKAFLKQDISMLQSAIIFLWKELTCLFIITFILFNCNEIKSNLSPHYLPLEDCKNSIETQKLTQTQTQEYLILNTKYRTQDIGHQTPSILCGTLDHNTRY